MFLLGDYGTAHAISEIVTQADVRILKLVLTGVCFWFVWPQTKKKRRVRTLSLAESIWKWRGPSLPHMTFVEGNFSHLAPSNAPRLSTILLKGHCHGDEKVFRRWNLCCYSGFYCRFNMWKNKLEVNQPCGSVLLTQCCFQEFIIRAGPNDRAGFILQPVNGI